MDALDEVDADDDVDAELDVDALEKKFIVCYRIT